mmetsp:Transcript_42566/g.43128  ORF Transcript_42566/g.43128 Transcript_42566/m.43128 type:complete len:214 (-) Transcript_42566:859-1500(-)
MTTFLGGRHSKQVTMAKIIRKKKHVIIIVIIVMISTVHLYLKRLQIHEIIVSLKDSSLEEYMPTIATSSYNTRTALPDRLATAVAMAARMFQTGAYMQLVCPDKQKLGFRPSDHIASKIGTTCEPWQNREMIGVLDHVLDPSMVALEWSTGSGTVCALTLLLSQIDIYIYTYISFACILLFSVWTMLILLSHFLPLSHCLNNQYGCGNGNTKK